MDSPQTCSGMEEKGWNLFIELPELIHAEEENSKDCFQPVISPTCKNIVGLYVKIPEGFSSTSSTTKLLRGDMFKH